MDCKPLGADGTQEGGRRSERVHWSIEALQVDDNQLVMLDSPAKVSLSMYALTL